ncbi:MarR family winged helix-turn-helix transcriptional regulator [Erythrobacter rubeus]|uniref:MarR family transcriptional regulator n=1 Tax=Erythrobacter rubeus TaxID=2760803 RepID=A0ABR8KKQ0_9SPHN|nr:MarR family transcriptional regulator [Erythrobacter rubeus]MBD2840863.1 MarR family transcriptional regulator [Erythrobacter rubeus]
MAIRLRLFDQLHAAHSALFRAADARLRETIGLGTAQQAILFLLVKTGSMPLSEVARRVGLGKSGLSGMVDRMEKAGLVERQRSESDGRSIMLAILPRGREMVDQSLPITKAINEELLEPFSQEDRATIARFLTHITNAAEPVVENNTSLQEIESTAA